MTFQTGTKVVLAESTNRGLIGTEGIVMQSFHEGSTRIKITKLPASYTEGWFNVGEPLGAPTQKFRTVSFPISELRKGDKIRVTMTAQDGTERVNTGIIDDLGEDNGYRQTPIRSKNRNALAFRSTEQGTSACWAAQVIELLERPAPKFDAESKIIGAVVSIHGTGTGVKIIEDTWVFVYGTETEYLTNEEFATRSADISRYVVLSEKPF